MEILALALGDPQHAALMRKMLNVGFSTLLARQLLNKMPTKKARELWAKAIDRNLQMMSEADDIVVKGGIYVLIGPTGVGKTFTTVKLAARAVLQHGADEVALLTNDSARAAARLNSFARIIGVAVHTVESSDELRLALSTLLHKHLVLIDTAGIGQRDGRVGDQNEMFDVVGMPCLLLLNATSSGDVLEDVVRMFHNKNVIGCIITKLDEAVNLGTVLDVALRHRLVVYYMTSGQQLPDDLLGCAE